MGKNKLKRFEEMKGFDHVFEPNWDDLSSKNFRLKGKWKNEFFNNKNPIVLELGCGKGEYAVNLAQAYPNKNFIGIDIKGARMWVGSKKAIELGLENIAFVRTKIELIQMLFEENEINEIWLTFPDPQIKKLKKRLSSASFLNSYKKLLDTEGRIHLKTDSELMFGFTKDIAIENDLPIFDECTDIYTQRTNDKLLTIKTFYEKQYLARDIKIKYLQFGIVDKEIINPEENEDRLQSEIVSRKQTRTNQIIRMRHIE